MSTKVYVLMCMECYEDINPVAVYADKAAADAEADRMNGPPSKRKRGYGFWVDECDFITHPTPESEIK
jgi:hypothetical protein